MVCLTMAIVCIKSVLIVGSVAAPIKNAQLPSVETTSPWDGKDGELPLEEEWDLSDVDLDDDVTKEEL
jgi:hypothetical protein